MQPSSYMPVDLTPRDELQPYLEVAMDAIVAMDADAFRLQQSLLHVSRQATVAEMAAGIAHELNQPLAAIVTYAQACDRLLNLPNPNLPEIRDAQQQIATQAVRAGDIIRRLRSLTRGESARREPADINAVIAELTLSIRADARAHGVEYRLEATPGLPKVAVDRAQIQQAVLNLVRNALEALALAQVDAGELVIRTRLTHERDVEISVSDNGTGVAAAVAQQMFDPFFSTKTAAAGLGLAISSTLIRAQDGTLVYRPGTSAGACFVVCLPQARPEVS